MIITCPGCSLRYRVKDDLISERGKKVKCKGCSAVFVAYRDKPSALIQAGKVAPPKPATSPSPAPRSAQPSGPPLPQATVRVDRSKLAEYVKTANPPQEKAETMGSGPATNFGENTPPAASEQIGATVQVDRSQIEAFLKKYQSGGGPSIPSTPEPVNPAPQMGPSTLKVDRDQLDAVLRKTGTGHRLTQEEPPLEMAGTIKVDRSQLDAVLKKTQGAAPPAAAPVTPIQGTAPPAQPTANEPMGTLKVDRSQLDRFLAKSQEEARAQKTADEHTLDATVADAGSIGDQPPIGLQSAGPQVNDQAPPPEDPPSFSPSMTDTPEDDLYFEDDFQAASDPLDDAAQEQNPIDFSDEPDFPSDEELGIDPDSEPTPPEAPLLETQEPPQPSSGSLELPAMEEPDPRGTSEPQEALYTVKVDGVDYPPKNLATIREWISSERFLDTDQISKSDSNDFREATSYPEIRALFDEFHGKTSQQDKGFFSKVFSFFKKR